MKKYRFSFQTIVSYYRPVTHHHFLFRCSPYNAGHQTIIEQQLHLFSDLELNETKDVFGNAVHYGSMKEKHDLFIIALSGIALCSEYIVFDEKPSPVFLSQTKMTQVNKKITTFGHIEDKGSSLDQALELASKIYNYLIYSPNTTSIETTALDCFELKKGVCQDYAHLMIALCRDRGIYARYVVGFVMGTGETHAWVEVYCNGAWYGIDPTHNILIDYGYIKIAHGRDANDCSVIRGMHRGEASHTTQVKVVVEEL